MSIPDNSGSLKTCIDWWHSDGLCSLILEKRRDEDYDEDVEETLLDEVNFFCIETLLISDSLSYDFVIC